MSDLIDRQAVIDLLKQMRKDGDMVPWEGKDVFARIRKLPTIQPEKAQLSQEGTTSDLIYRQQAIDAVRASYDEILDFKSTGRTIADSVEDILSELPAAESEFYWRQFKTRPLTEEEKELHPDIDLILDCDLPKNGQKILITVNEPGHEPVQTDVFCDDGECSLDSLYEIETEATAWMPLPDPYKGGAK